MRVDCFDWIVVYFLFVYVVLLELWLFLVNFLGLECLLCDKYFFDCVILIWLFVMYICGYMLVYNVIYIMFIFIFIEGGFVLSIWGLVGVDS